MWVGLLPQLESLKRKRLGSPTEEGGSARRWLRPRSTATLPCSSPCMFPDCPALSHYTNQSLFSWSAVALQCCQFPLQPTWPLSLDFLPHLGHHGALSSRVTCHAQSRACQSQPPNSSHALSPWAPHMCSPRLHLFLPCKPINVTQPVSLKTHTSYRFYFPIHL